MLLNMEGCDITERPVIPSPVSRQEETVSCVGGA
ncbi:hypothetical protein BV96_00509 [Sphingomonas paucimobilis]|nr:hypothetical protein BV96_00509 [Sphingomonas paucimobilis]